MEIVIEKGLVIVTVIVIRAKKHNYNISNII